jgi:hypothetical protein
MIWIEILSWHRDVAARFGVAGDAARIGRGYDNDVVIDDPYVAARHVRVSRDGAGRLVAEDAGSKNGMFLDRSRIPQARIVIDPERPIRIGHTFVRIRDAACAVPSERVVGARPQTSRVQTRLAATAAGLAIALLGSEALFLWLSQTAEPRASTYLNSLLFTSGLALTWVAFWTILSRVFSGRARFAQNLIIALSGFLLLALDREIGPFAAFAFTWPSVVSYQYAVQSCIIAGACFFHLRELGRTRLVFKGGLVGALLAFAIIVQAVLQSESASDFGQQVIVRRLMPPALRLGPVRGESDFFAEIERLKTGLDRDRALQAP